MALAKRVNSVMRTMDIALTSCVPPTKGTSLFEHGDDEMEVGIGIYGEPGRRRERTNADAIVDELLAAILPDLPFESGDEVAVMVNGLGGTPIGELYLLYGIAREKLEKKGIRVAKNYVGEYCTSLDMAGAAQRSLSSTTKTELLEAPAGTAMRRATFDGLEPYELEPYSFGDDYKTDLPLSLDRVREITKDDRYGTIPAS